MSFCLLSTLLILRIYICQSQRHYYSVTSTEFTELNNPLYSYYSQALPQEITQCFKSLSGTSIHEAYKHPNAGYYLLFEKPKRGTYHWAIVSKEATEATVTTLHSGDITQQNQDIIKTAIYEIKRVHDFKRIAIELEKRLHQQSVQEHLKIEALQQKVSEQHETIQQMTKPNNVTNVQLNQSISIQTQTIQHHVDNDENMRNISELFRFERTLNKNLSDKNQELMHILHDKEVILMNMSQVIKQLKVSNKEIPKSNNTRNNTVVYVFVIMIVGVICIIIMMVWRCNMRNRAIYGVQVEVPQMHTFMDSKPILQSMARTHIKANSLSEDINVENEIGDGNETIVNDWKSEKFGDMLDNTVSVQDVILDDIVDEMETNEGV